MDGLGSKIGSITCIGPSDPKVMFSPRCGKKATWRSPVGPLCDECAERERAAISSGETVLNVIAEMKGISRATLLSKYVRLT